MPPHTDDHTDDDSAQGTGPHRTPGKHTAGAFDIRNFIGALLGLYGVILTLMGLFGERYLDRTGGINANLYAGLGLLVVAVVFMTWARLRPIVVPAHVEPVLEDPTRPSPRTRRDGH